MTLRTQVSAYSLVGDTLGDRPDPSNVPQGYTFLDASNGFLYVLVIEADNTHHWVFVNSGPVSTRVIPTGIPAIDVPAIRAALAAMAGVGTVYLAAGTFAIGPFGADNGSIEIPSNTRLIGMGPTETILSCSGGQPFTCNQLGNITCQGTIDTSSLVDALTVSVDVLVGSLIVGQPIEIRGAVPRNFQGAAYLIRNISGVGPFTVTLDRPAVWAFQAGDEVTCYATQGHNIYLSGFSMTGTSTGRAIELLEVRDSTLEDITVHDFVGTSDRLVSFDSFSFNCTHRRIEIYNCGNINALACEQNERALVDECYVHNMGSREGIAITDNADTVVRNCKVDTCGAEGLLISGEVPTSNASLRTRVEGGVYIKNQKGIRVQAAQDTYVSSAAVGNGALPTDANCVFDSGATGYVEGIFTDSPGRGIDVNASTVEIGVVDCSRTMMGLNDGGNVPSVDHITYDGPAVDGGQAIVDNFSTSPLRVKGARVLNSHGNAIVGLQQFGSGHIDLQEFDMVGGAPNNSRLISVDTGVIYLAHGRLGAAQSQIWTPSTGSVNICEGVEFGTQRATTDSEAKAMIRDLAALLSTNARMGFFPEFGVTRDANGISALVDQFGRNYMVSQVTNVNKPTYGWGINGRPAFLFDQSGTGTFLASASGGVAITFPLTVYFVVTASQVAPSGIVADMSSGAGRAVIVINNTPGIGIYAGVTTITAPASFATPHVVCCVFNGATSAIYIDNSQVAAVSGNPGTSAACDTIQFGSSAGTPTNPLIGALGGIFLVDGADTAQARSQRMAILGEEYQIAVT